MNEYYLKVLKEQVKPATGCTEPVAIALACAKVSSLLSGKIKKMKVTASKGLYKNASAVGIPGTDQKGIAMAVFLGYCVKRPELGMRILEAATEEDKQEALTLMAEHELEIGYTESDYDVYVDASLETEQGQATAIISGSHDHFSFIEVNGEVLLDTLGAQSGESEDSLDGLKETSIEDLVDFSQRVSIDEISWLEESVELNAAISRLGQDEDYGLGIGKGLQRMIDRGVLCNDLLSRIRIWVSAAADARMGGAKLPVMTSCGSGNQGILISLPLMLYAKEKDYSAEVLQRALCLANLVNAKAKAYLGKLSPLCGCSVSAGLGAAAGLTWMAGGTLPQIEGAIKGMIANLTGTLCDGAKGTCSLKLETAAVEAYTYAMLSLDDVYLHDTQGIVEISCEASIANLEDIGKQGMEQMDQTVLSMLDRRN